MSTHTDNAHLGAKLELRRHFLRRYHKDAPIAVLDCFQGGGVIWNRLKSEFDIPRYWGVDLKPKKGRLRIDSERILEQRGWNQNVVDLDAYGSPWGHWLNLLRTCQNSVTVFLTFGIVKIGGGQLDPQLLQVVGLKFRHNKVPGVIGVRLAETATAYVIRAAEEFGFNVVEVAEGFPQRNARYLGVRLEKKEEKSAQTG